MEVSVTTNPKESIMTKTVAVAFTFLIFVLGGLAVADDMAKQPRPKTVTYVSKKVNVTPEQGAKIAAIRNKHYPKIRELQAQLKAVRLQMDTEIEEVLG